MRDGSGGTPNVAQGVALPSVDGSASDSPSQLATAKRGNALYERCTLLHERCSVLSKL